ncbi:MAG: hypothetical protein RR336_02960, partial [Oscillospiraceae bacterium]
MAIPHITPEQVAQYGVVASPDRLTGKPADNKAVFDRLVRELVTAAVNNVIDQTNALLLTEAERTTNENGRTAAETSRVNAETLRVAAEKARVNAETARVTAENSRVLAEKSRTDNETARKAAETARVDAETARVAAEVLRVEAEKARVAAETARATEEKTRSTAETARGSAEGTRKTQEDARQTAEQGRATNEDGRGTAEQNRAAAELLRAGAENTRSGAEEARKTAETNRALAEDGRVTAETVRTGAEETRKTAENERAARDAADALCETYQQTHDYIVGNKVLYIGSTYRCIKPCRGVVPTTAANWMVFAEKGADGKGSGDMLASVYDKAGKRQDVFEFAETKKKEAITEAATDAKTKADTAEKNAKDASRPTSWTPSASDVGAAPSSHVGDSTHATLKEKTAWNGKAAGTHTHPMKDLTDFPGYATKAEAEAGVDEKKLMSPLRVREAMEAHP